MESIVEQKALQASGLAAQYPPSERTAVLVVPNFPALGKLAAMRFLEWVQQNPEGVVSLPTGKTPEFFIKEVKRLSSGWKLREVARELEEWGLDPGRPLSLSSLHFVQIDEFYPINPLHYNSFHYYVSRFYLEGFGLDRARALLIDCSRIGLPPGRRLEEVWPEGEVDLSLRYRQAAGQQETLQKDTLERVDQWCVEYEERIRQLGGIGFFLGGIGPDGHIGFNVRGSDLFSTTRLAPVNYETQAAAASDLGGIEVARRQPGDHRRTGHHHLQSGLHGPDRRRRRGQGRHRGRFPGQPAARSLPGLGAAAPQAGPLLPDPGGGQRPGGPAPGPVEPPAGHRRAGGRAHPGGPVPAARPPAVQPAGGRSGGPSLRRRAAAQDRRRPCPGRQPAAAARRAGTVGRRPPAGPHRGRLPGHARRGVPAHRAAPRRPDARLPALHRAPHPRALHAALLRHADQRLHGGDQRLHAAAVPQAQGLAGLRGLRRSWPSRSTSTRPTWPVRNRDVWHYLDGVAADSAAVREDGEMRRLYRNLVEVYEEKDRAVLSAPHR